MDDSRVLNGVIHVIQTGLRWREVLLSLKSRGRIAPELATGDGAMGFWAALDEVYPETRQQRCCQRKIKNVLNACQSYLSQRPGPRGTTSGRPRPKMMPKRHSIYSSKSMRPSIPKAALCLQKDREELVASLNFPAQPRPALANHPHQQSN